MKPSTNFKITVGILLLIFFAVTFYFMVRDFNKRSDNLTNPQFDKTIIGN